MDLKNEVTQKSSKYFSGEGPFRETTLKSETMKAKETISIIYYDKILNK